MHIRTDWNFLSFPGQLQLGIDLQLKLSLQRQLIAINTCWEYGPLSPRVWLKGAVNFCFLKDKASIPTDDLITLVRWCCRNKTIRNWNALPNSVLSSAEGTELSLLLWWEGLISLVMVLVNDCHSDMSPVNNSDSPSTMAIRTTVVLIRILIGTTCR